jgi:hypothetical protein
MKMSASTDLVTCSRTAPTLWAAFTVPATLATRETASAARVSCVTMHVSQNQELGGTMPRNICVNLGHTVIH